MTFKLKHKIPASLCLYMWV